MRFIARQLAILAICTIGAPLATHAADFQIAADGKPRATIVLAPDAREKTALAAEDLQHYVRRICGVELPIARDGLKPADGAAIYIGPCKTARPEDLPPETIAPETFAIRLRDGDLYLTGRAWHARMFAVYDFIENELGVRWYAPGERWEMVPKGKPGALTVRVSPRVVEPDWSPRIWSGHACTAEWGRWLDRNKAQSYEPIVFRGFQNYVYRIFPPEKYAKDHPEYYPLVKGKRWIPPNAKDRYWRPCESNPEVQRIVVEHARKWFDEHPERNSFSLGMDDVVHMCGCDKCRAWDPDENAYRRREFSDRHYKFVNLVARELAKTHPDKFVGTLCYNIARELPETVDKLEPNVLITMTQRCADWWRPDRKRDDMELTRQWHKRARHMNRYDYIGLGFLTPRVFPHALAEAMQFDHALGFHGVYNECYDLLPTTAPMMWMMAKLQWDTDQDPDALLNAFYEDMFGKARKTMRKYFETLEHGWNDPRPDRVASSNWGHRDLVSQAMALPLEDLDKAEDLIARALANARDETVRSRIETVRAALQYGSYPIRLLGMSQRMEKTLVKDEKAALSVFADMQTMAQLSAERARFWPEALKRKDLFGESLRGLKKRGYFVVEQASRVEGGGGTALVRAIEYLQKHAPDKLAAALKDFDAGSAMGELAHAAATVVGTNPPNLLRNPGFDEEGENKAKAERDWSTQGAPAGWSTWSSGGGDVEFGAEPGAGRDGSVAGSIRGPVKGCFIQSFDVETGQKYLVRGWARRDPEGDPSGFTLLLRWRTAKGWFKNGARDVSVGLPGETDGWTLLALLAKVPQGATRASLLVLSQRGAGKGRILVDDISVQKVP